MAASVEDVIADVGYVENPMTYALCEATIDYDEAASEMTSKYVAGATIFNFLWQAYGNLEECCRRLLELPDVAAWAANPVRLWAGPVLVAE